MSEELKIAKQWLAKAKNDLLNADNNLKSDEVPFDTVCFHCQQFAEKYLKACLIDRGVRPPRIHHLARLLDLVVEEIPTCELARDLVDILETYAVDVRYPGNQPTRRAARNALKAAEELREVLGKNSLSRA